MPPSGPGLLSGTTPNRVLPALPSRQDGFFLPQLFPPKRTSLAPLTFLLTPYRVAHSSQGRPASGE